MMVIAFKNNVASLKSFNRVADLVADLVGKRFRKGALRALASPENRDNRV